ncbi:hypothetical protein HK102_006939 [Quaeritorhiza haematococci]|nr:hypothetical protein HK102_006939 [Quaeritorhiza haematococci]
MSWSCKGQRSARHAFFLSYRVATERELLERFHPLLKRIAKRRAREPVLFFWDRHCLNEGKDFEVGFRNGLKQSDSVVYFISKASIDIMAEKLFQNREAKIIPIILKNDFPDAGSFIDYAFKTIPKDAVHVASGKSAHDTFGLLFRNQVIPLNVETLHDIVYDILTLGDQVRERANGEDM